MLIDSDYQSDGFQALRVQVPFRALFTINPVYCLLYYHLCLFYI